MSRPRAGHGSTRINGIDAIGNDAGEWIPSGKAKGWPRCLRCRRPTESFEELEGYCTTCFFYRLLPTAEDFWSYKECYLFPYNIGARSAGCDRLEYASVAQRGEHRTRNAKEQVRVLPEAPS